MKLNSKIFLTAILTASVAGAASANTVMDIYAGGMFGAGGSIVYNDGDHHSFSSRTFGAIAGIDIPLLRVEAEYNHMVMDDTSTNSAMLNAYFKMMSTIIHPYVGVGVGSVFGGEYSKNHVDYDVKTTVAYQGMLGLTFDVMALPIKFDIEGRALYAPNFIHVADNKPDLVQYDARLKLRYIF